MKAPLSWIREFTPVDAPVEEIAAALNQLGLEVEAIGEPGRELGGVVVARILDVSPHPDADKLTLVDVEHGDGQTRVVCGAPNVVAGMLVPYAPVGATLPGGLRLERRKIRGVTSDGMLCSARELGLGDDHAGILDIATVEPSAALGADVRDVLGLDDTVFDLSITPNRPDAMCIVGVARELAAHFGDGLEVPVPQVPVDPALATGIRVTIDEPGRCPRYLAWSAPVSVGPSPAWVQQRLVKAGMRPISNVVDITNYVLLERNQPLHAFDLDRLAGRGIVVRCARSSERLRTLDGVERTLDGEDLVICDAESQPQAIAGIMGGGDSEVSDATTEILLEAAHFERMGIARSAKRLKLRSEASARFERGTDPDGVAQSAARAIELLAAIAGTSAVPKPVDEYPQPAVRPKIRLRTSKVNGVLGAQLSDSEVTASLVPLGIDVEGTGDELVATPPTFRPDLEREIDLVEEVARRIGFASIGRTVPKPREQVGALTRHQLERRLVADALVGAGLSEAVTLPLVAPGTLEVAGAPTERLVRVANPLRAEDSALRTRIVPGLLQSVATNQARGLGDVALFEVGHVFLAPTTKKKQRLLPDEPTHVAAVLAGGSRRAPVDVDRAVDAYDAVDALRAVFDALELAAPRLVPGERPGFEPGRAAGVEVDGVDAGSVGELSEAACAALLVTPPAVGFEVDLDRLLEAPRRDRTFVSPSPYPPATIDLAFVVDDAVPASVLADTLRSAAADLVEDVRVFDEFTSDALGPGRKSLAFAVRFRSPDCTLTDADVAELRGRCIDAVVRAHQAELRG